MIGDIRSEIKAGEYGVATFKTLFFLIPAVSLALLGSGFAGVISGVFAEGMADHFGASETGTSAARYVGFAAGFAVTIGAFIVGLSKEGTDRDC